MKKYISPLAIENDILAEAIYAASGVFPDTPDKPGDNPGDNPPDNPGDNTPDNPGDNTPDNPGDNTPDNPGDNTPDNPGDNTPDNPGDNTPDNPGDNTPDNPGDNTPDNPGDNNDWPYPPLPESNRDPATDYGHLPGKDYDHDPECWTITPQITQTNVNHDPGQEGENWAVCRIQCDHSNVAIHHSDQTQVVLVFDRPIARADFEGNPVSVNGDTVTGTRALLGDSYGSGDNYNSQIKVWPVDANAEGIQVIKADIYCTHNYNVQGGFD